MSSSHLMHSSSVVLAAFVLLGYMPWAKASDAAASSRGKAVHKAAFVPGMEVGNISPNGGEGISGLRGGFGLSGCCQVCPENFYTELNFIELGVQQKLDAINRFHGQFGLPPIPAKHAKAALKLARDHVASTKSKQRSHVGPSASAEAALLQMNSKARHLGFVGGAVGALTGGALPGFARMKTGAPYGKFGGGKCCPVCLGDYIPVTQSFIQESQSSGVIVDSGHVRIKGVDSQNDDSQNDDSQTIDSQTVDSQTVNSQNDDSQNDSPQNDDSQNNDSQTESQNVASQRVDSQDAGPETGLDSDDAIDISEAVGSGIVESNPSTTITDTKSIVTPADASSEISSAEHAGNKIVSNGKALADKVGDMASDASAASATQLHKTATQLDKGAQYLAKSAKTLEEKARDGTKVLSGMKDATSSAYRAAASTANKVVSPLRQALTGEYNSRPYDETLNGVKCCQICIQQLYPPRDFIDVQTFLELDEVNKIPSMIEVQNGIRVGQKRRAWRQSKGFVDSIGKFLIGGSGATQVNQYDDSCSCRMCQDNMIGLGGGFFPKPLPDGAPRKKSRNPMNKRQYPSLVEISTDSRAPVKGGITLECPSKDKGSTACCYLFCQRHFEACEANEAESDRQEDSDCKARRTTCQDECAVGGSAPRTWGTHNE